MLRCHVRISRDDLMKLWPSPGEAGRNVHGDLVSVATIAPAGGAEDAGAERAEAEANTGTPGNLKAGVGRPKRGPRPVKRDELVERLCDAFRGNPAALSGVPEKILTDDFDATRYLIGVARPMALERLSAETPA